jgi:hypothetical protein
LTKVSKTDFYRIPGVYEPIEYVVETHTICDVCGSADIGYKADAHVPEFLSNILCSLLWVSLLGFIILALGASVLGIFKYNRMIFGIGMISVVDFLLFSCLTSIVERNNTKNPKCRKCGNEHIT